MFHLSLNRFIYQFFFIEFFKNIFKNTFNKKNFFYFFIFLTLFFSCKPEVKEKSSSSSPTPEFEITFEVNGGSAVDTQTITEGSKVSKPDNPTKANFVFDAWYSDSGLTQEYDFSKGVTGAITLYAKWLVSKTVTFNVNGGSAVANITVGEGQKVTKPTEPTRANFTFAGWYKDTGLTQVFNFTTELITADTTLYAKWQVTVTFDVDGGSAVANVVLDIGSKVTKPADPTKTGFTFVNWYKENSFQNIFNFTTETVSVNTTIYAKFNRPPVLTALANENSFDNRFVVIEIDLFGVATHSDINLNDYFNDPDGDNLTFSFISVFQNGGNDDKKNQFSIGVDNKITTSITSVKNDQAKIGYYYFRLQATDTWGGTKEFYMPAQAIYQDLASQTLDISSITTPARLIFSGSTTNYYRTGSADDIIGSSISTGGGIFDLGAGENIYQVYNISTKLYFYNFNDGDKIQFDKEGHFKDYQFSSYANRADVVATGNSRIIYITSTGELYRDENGDAVYKSSDSSVDLKTGSNEHRIAKLYSSAYNPGDTAETSGTPANFDTDDFEIVDF